jgi:hypothetical protein
VTITQTFDYGGSSTDSVKDAFVRLQPGLLGNPQNAAFCSQQQFQADNCPADSKVGTVEVSATVHILVIPAPTTNSGIVYNLRPTGSEPARVGVVVEAAGGLSKIFLQSPVYIRPGADGYGLESTFADQPRDSAGIPIQITKVALTFNGKASKGPFMRMPTSCAQGTSLSRANSWEAQSAFSEKTFAMTPTGCDSLGLRSEGERVDGRAGAHAPGGRGAGVHHSDLRSGGGGAEERAGDAAEHHRPERGGPQPGVPARPGGREQPARPPRESAPRGSTRPCSRHPSKVPSISRSTATARCRDCSCCCRPPVGVRLDGLVDVGPSGVTNTFASNPDLPVRSFSLSLDGGPDAALKLFSNLCADGIDRTMEARLVAYNGKEAVLSQELATPGCDPTARFTIRRKGPPRDDGGADARRTVGPGITQFGLRLPKTLSRGKARPLGVRRRRRMRPHTGRRMASMPFPREVPTATLVWRGLKTGRHLKKTAVDPPPHDGQPPARDLGEEEGPRARKGAPQQQ